MTVMFGNESALNHHLQSILGKVASQPFLKDFANAWRVSVPELICPCPFCCGAQPKLCMKTTHMLGTGSDTKLRETIITLLS